jgi:hypothetical protein
MITMKSIKRFLLVVTLLGAPALFAAGSGATSAYEQAVAAYIEGATQQLRAIRTDVDTAVGKAGEAGRRTYAEVYRGLDQCDATLALLRVAGPRDFDLIKANFEKTRAQMIATLDAARKTAPTVQSQASATSSAN